MADVKRYWTDHLWTELLVLAESIGAKEVVLAADYNTLEQRCEQMELFKKGVTPKHAQLLQRAEQAETKLVVAQAFIESLAHSACVTGLVNADAQRLLEKLK